jgi:hypothetical protein
MRVCIILRQILEGIEFGMPEDGGGGGGVGEGQSCQWLEEDLGGEGDGEEGREGKGMRERERERVGESEMRKRRFEGRKLEGGIPRCERSFVLVNIESYEYTPPPLLVFMQGGHMSLTRFGGHWGRSA